MTDERTMKLSDLTDNGACRPSREAFVRLYGAEGNVVTMERVMEGALDFDWVFAATNLLTPKQQAYFKSLVIQAFRLVNRVEDRDKVKRRKAMALAFYKAYNSPLE